MKSETGPLQIFSGTEGFERANDQLRHLRAFERIEDGKCCGLHARLCIHDHQHGRAGAAQGNSQDAVGTGKGQQRAATEDKWPLGRADECGRSWRCAADLRGLGQRRAQQSYGLNVDHHIGAGIGRGQHGTGFAGGQRLDRENDDGPPVGRRGDLGDVDGTAFACGDNKTAEPAGGSVVGVAFQHGGFFKDALAIPAKLAEVNGEGNGSQPPCAEEPQPMPSGIPLAMRMARGITGRPFSVSNRL